MSILELGTVMNPTQKATLQPGLGKVLRLARKSKKMKLRELSGKTGVSISGLSQIELGRISPTSDNLIKICNCLGIKIDPAAVIEKLEKLDSSHAIIAEEILTYDPKPENLLENIHAMALIILIRDYWTKHAKHRDDVENAIRLICKQLRFFLL